MTTVSRTSLFTLGLLGSCSALAAVPLTWPVDGTHARSLALAASDTANLFGVDAITRNPAGLRYTRSGQELIGEFKFQHRQAQDPDGVGDWTFTAGGFSRSMGLGIEWAAHAFPDRQDELSIGALTVGVGLYANEAQSLSAGVSLTLVSAGKEGTRPDDETVYGAYNIGVRWAPDPFSVALGQVSYDIGLALAYSYASGVEVRHANKPLYAQPESHTAALALGVTLPWAILPGYLSLMASHTRAAAVVGAKVSQRTATGLEYQTLLNETVQLVLRGGSAITQAENQNDRYTVSAGAGVVWAHKRELSLAFSQTMPGSSDSDQEPVKSVALDYRHYF